MMKDFTDYFIYLLFEIIVICVAISYFGFSFHSGLFLTIYFILSPTLIYVKHFGLGRFSTKYKDTLMYNLQKVIRKKMKSTRLDKVYLITYILLIFFGISLIIFNMKL